MAVRNSNDPSRTITLRRRARAETLRRYRTLAVKLKEKIVTEDAFGLAGRKAILFNAGDWRFQSDPDKVASFREWLQAMIDVEILLPIGGIAGQPWTADYIDSAYKQGYRRAYSDVKPIGPSAQPEVQLGGQREFLRDSFRAPETTRKLELLYTRTFDQLEGFNQELGGTTSRILTEGLAHGKGVLSIANDLIEATGMTRNRAERLVRTEIIYAHAEGQLDGMEKLGVEEVGAIVEWATAGNPCPRCAEMAGQLYTIAAARGLIPLHPNCRCSWTPAPLAVRRNPSNFRVIGT